MLAFFSPPVILSVVAVIQLFCTQKLHVFARFLIIYRFSKDVKPKVLNFFEFPVIVAATRTTGGSGRWL